MNGCAWGHDDRNAGVRVAFVHPPGQAAPVQLDGYCSQRTKGGYRWQPIDFIVLGGSLRPDIGVAVFDLGSRVALGGDRLVRELAERLRAFSPTHIVFLIGVVEFASQTAFVKALRAAMDAVDSRSGVECWATGDLARAHPDFVLAEVPDIDGIILEMATPDFRDYLLSGERRIGCANLVMRGDPMDRPSPKPMPLRGFKISPEIHSRFEHSQYRLPFPVPHPFASVVTQVGCPFGCSYCILSQYSLAERDLGDVKRELTWLRRKGYRHVYIRDPTVNAHSSHFLPLLDLLRDSGLSWNAFARPDTLTDVERVRRSGASVLQFGIDHYDGAALDAYGKPMKQGRLRQAVEQCRQAGILTVGHFVLGIGNSREEGDRILDWAHDLGLDYIAVSPLVVRPSTALWQQRVTEAGSVGRLLAQFDSDLPSYAGVDDVDAATVMRRHHMRPVRVARELTYYLRRPSAMTGMLHAFRAVTGSSGPGRPAVQEANIGLFV